MDYTVCYAIYGSKTVEASSADAAVDDVCGMDLNELTKGYDDFAVTLVVDEDGREYFY